MALPRDRYVIRSYSPMVTIGGGELLDVAPPKARRSPALAARLRILENGRPRPRSSRRTSSVRRAAGARTAELRARTPSAPKLSGASPGAPRAGARLRRRPRVVRPRRSGGALREEAIAALAAFHAREPLKPGMSKEELRTRLGSLEERVFLALLERFAAAGVLVVDEDKVRGAGHAVRLTPTSRRASDRIEAEFREAGVAPPTLDEAFAKLGLTGSSAQADGPAPGR